MQFIKDNTRMVIVAIALGFGLNTSVRSLLFQSENEIAYVYKNSISSCLPGMDLCIYTGDLLLANTGDSPSEHITITLSNLSDSLRFTTAVVNLSAANPRSHDPQLNMNETGNGRVLVIDDLAPGTLVKLQITSDPSFDREQAQFIQNLEIDVESNGAVVKGDPQGTEIGRILLAFL